MGGFLLFRFIKKHKFVSIVTGLFIVFFISMALLIMFSYFAAMSYYKSSSQQNQHTSVNVGKASYTYYIPPATKTPNAKYNINQDYEDALKALEQIIGQPYTKTWLAGYLGITDTNSPWFNWIYAMYPYALVGYYRGSVLPSISLSQSGLVSKLGKSASSTSANNLYDVSGNPSNWMYAEAGSGGKSSGGGGTSELKVLPLKWKAAMGSNYTVELTNQFNAIGQKIGIPAWFLAADSMKECNFGKMEGMSKGSTGAGILQFNISGAPGGIWESDWNLGMGKFISECGGPSSRVAAFEKFTSGDTVVQIASGAWEQMYYLNMSYYWNTKHWNPSTHNNSDPHYIDISNMKNINFNKFFAPGLDQTIINNAEAMYNMGQGGFMRAGGGPDTDSNYWRGIHDEALVLFGVYTGDPGHGHIRSYKSYSNVADINPSITGATQTVSVPTGGSSSGSSTGLIKYSCQGASLASMANHQGGVGAVSSATSDSGQLSAIASNGLLYGTTVSDIQTIITKYNLAKLDLFAPQVKTIMQQLEKGNTSSKNPTSTPPGVVNKNWAPPKNLRISGNIMTAWKPTNAATLFSYYHLSSSGVPAKLMQMIDHGAAEMGSPYVWGAKGVHLKSVSQADAIISHSGGNGSQEERTAEFIRDNNIPMNGSVMGFDCSGFVGYAYSTVFGNTPGMNPGSTVSQSSSPALSPIGSSKPIPGDIVFYYESSNTSPSNSDHVGIFLKFENVGGVKCPLLLEAPRSGAGVMVGIDTPGKTYKIFKINAAF